MRELARTLRAQAFAGTAAEIGAVRRAVPATVARSVSVRLRSLDDATRALVRAVAVLGDRAELRHAAELTGLSRDQLSAAHARAAAVELLDRGRTRFLHPLVGEVVRTDLPAVERSELHRRAAEILIRDGGDEDAIAAHLMATEPGADEGVARRLGTAGRRALARGAPDVAARHLERALHEPPAPDERAALLLELGIAEARSGTAGAVERLSAAAAAGDPAVRARAVQALVRATIMHEYDPAVIDELRAVLTEPAALPADLVSRLEGDLLDLLPYRPADHEEYVARLAAGASADWPPALAHLAFLRAVSGAPRAEVCALAQRALGEGRLLREVEVESRAPYYAIEALHLVEAASQASAALREARVGVQRSGSPVVVGGLAHAETAWERQSAA